MREPPPKGDKKADNFVAAASFRSLSSTCTSELALPNAPKTVLEKGADPVVRHEAVANAP